MPQTEARHYQEPMKLNPPTEEALASCLPFVERYIASGRLEALELERATTLKALAQAPEHFENTTAHDPLMSRFDLYGRLCIFDSGAARAEDFRNNQGQGAWAERLLLNAKWPGYKLVPFGPSDDVIPNDIDYEIHRPAISGNHNPRRKAS